MRTAKMKGRRDMSKCSSFSKYVEQGIVYLIRKMRIKITGHREAIPLQNWVRQRIQKQGGW